MDDEVNQTFEKEKGGILTGSVPHRLARRIISSETIVFSLPLFFRFESTFRNGEIITAVSNQRYVAFCQCRQAVIDVYHPCIRDPESKIPCNLFGGRGEEFSLHPR